MPRGSHTAAFFFPRPFAVRRPCRFGASRGCPCAPEVLAPSARCRRFACRVCESAPRAHRPAEAADHTLWSTDITCEDGPAPHLLSCCCCPSRAPARRRGAERTASGPMVHLAHHYGRLRVVMRRLRERARDACQLKVPILAGKLPWTRSNTFDRNAPRRRPPTHHGVLRRPRISRCARHERRCALNARRRLSTSPSASKKVRRSVWLRFTVGRFTCRPTAGSLERSNWVGQRALRDRQLVAQRVMSRSTRCVTRYYPMRASVTEEPSGTDAVTVIDPRAGSVAHPGECRFPATRRLAKRHHAANSCSARGPHRCSLAQESQRRLYGLELFSSERRESDADQPRAPVVPITA